MAVEIVFETHSISTDNERGIATGWLPGELSEAGRAAARALGERRRAQGFAAVYASDLRRAVETAEIAFEGAGVPIHHDARLRECNYGRLNGMSVAQLDAERSQHVDDPFPDGESYRQVVTRVQTFLREVASAHDEQRILVIGHSATQWAIEHLINGTSLEELASRPRTWQPGWSYSVREPV